MGFPNKGTLRRVNKNTSQDTHCTGTSHTKGAQHKIPIPPILPFSANTPIPSQPWRSQKQSSKSGQK